MSRYMLQKAIREINRNPGVREAFFAAPGEMLKPWPLTDEERGALVARDYGALYRLGVHGLLLRPFSLLHAVPEPDYLQAIRAEAPQS